MLASTPKLLVIFFLILEISSAMTREIDRGSLPAGCVCLASKEGDPICGNDGITYLNLATLRCANNCVKYSIHPMHHGPCKP